MFLYALNSPVSRERYTTRLRWFFSKINWENDTEDKANLSMEDLCKIFVEKGKQDPNWVVKNMIEFLMQYKERYDRREVTGSTIRNYIKPVKLLCEMNDIIIHWKKITRGLPKGRQWADDRAPSIEEIRKLCEYPDRRIKPIVYLMCSSGIRLGAWDYLHWEDIMPIKDDRGNVIAAKVSVYAGEEDHYYTYCSPEAFNALKAWMDYRQSSGENIRGKSWLMRDLWDTIDPRINGSVHFPKKKKSSGIKRLIENAWYSQGVRKQLEQGKTRHEFQAVHGFRKFYKTHCELSGMKPSIIEVTMSHSLGGVSDSYFRPTEGEIFEEYLKALDMLSINNENKLKMRVEELEKAKAQEVLNADVITTLSDQVMKLMLEVQELKRRD